MPIVASDIKFKFSVKTGAAGHSTAGNADGSLGKYISTTEITDNVLNNLFDDVSGDENAASDVEYRCFFVHNAHATLPLTTAVVWLSAEVAGGAAAAIAVDATAASVIGASSAQAAEVATEQTSPGAGAGTFSAPATKGTGLSLGTIDAGKCKAIWVRRTASASAALDDDGATIRVEGDTAA